jgi:hypothetical protein
VKNFPSKHLNFGAKYRQLLYRSQYTKHINGDIVKKITDLILNNAYFDYSIEEEIKRLYYQREILLYREYG